MRFAIAIATSAFLLFQVQPMLAKYVLPWFGGSPSVWTTCMLFFQSLLLVGYAYAHALARVGSRTRQAALHVGLVGASLLFLPLAPGDAWRPEGGENAGLRILLFLLVTIGPPYLMLSSTGPLLQRWFADVNPGRSPYRLYALSNAASLAALLSYPVLFEPAFEVTTQLGLWTAGYLGFALLTGACAWRLARGGAAPPVPASVDPPRAAGAPVTPGRVALWIALAACASTVLLGATNQLCLDLASVPLLWVLPLALYLVSFMLTFERDDGYRRDLWIPALVVLLPPAGFAQILGGEWPLGLIIPLFCALILVACTICHGELVRLKPAPEHLTGFYLAVAAGGALGAVFVNLLAPWWFDHLLELPLGLLAAHLIVLVILMRDPGSRLAGGRPLWAWGLLIVAGWAAGLPLARAIGPGDSIDASRSFYGVYQVKEPGGDGPPRRVLAHGSTLHGTQLTGPGRRREATAYFGPDAGIGVALRALPELLGESSVRVGILGLGVGTLATYAREGDALRFYEIDPEVVRIAREHFSFLADTRGDVSLVIGDGRLQIEREVEAGSEPPLDLLALDAFTSDAVPTHLLTAEAFEIYWRRLRPDGVLAVNVSNRYVDLAPIVRAAAARVGARAWRVESGEDEDREIYPADWILVSRDERLSTLEPVRSAIDPWPEDARPPTLWTDRYSNLFGALRDWWG